MKLRGTLLLASVLLSLAGCAFRQEPSPNDPNTVNATRQPKVIQEYLQQLSSVINDSVLNRQISPAKGDQLMVQGTRDYLAKVKLKQVPDDELWMLGEAFITAKEWQEAMKYLVPALKADKGPDRIVNDTLRISRCYAELGDADNAIKFARQAFSAPADWKWPILYAVYLEIVPAAEKTKPSARLELAKLTEDAIAQHEMAAGSADNPAQHDWVMLRQFHITRAWDLVIKLYNDAGRKDLAKAALAKQQAPSSQSKSVQA